MTSTIYPVEEAKNINSIADVPDEWQDLVRRGRSFTRIDNGLALVLKSIEKAALIAALQFKIQNVAGGKEDYRQECHDGERYYFRCRTRHFTKYFGDIGSVGKLRRLMDSLVEEGWVFKKNLPTISNPKAMGYAVNEERCEAVKNMLLDFWQAVKYGDRDTSQPSPTSVGQSCDRIDRTKIGVANPAIAPIAENPISGEVAEENPTFLGQSCDRIDRGNEGWANPAIASIAPRDQSDRIDFIYKKKSPNEGGSVRGEENSFGQEVAEALLPLPQDPEIGKGGGEEEKINISPSPTESRKPEIKTDPSSRKEEEVPPSPAKLPSTAREEMFLGDFTLEDRERLHSANMETWLKKKIEDQYGNLDRLSHASDPWTVKANAFFPGFDEFFLKAFKKPMSGEQIYCNIRDARSKLRKSAADAAEYWVYFCEAKLARWKAEERGILPPVQPPLTPKNDGEIIGDAPDGGSVRDEEGLTSEQRALIEAVLKGSANYEFWVDTAEEAIENIKKYNSIGAPGQEMRFMTLGGYSQEGVKFMEDPGNAGYYLEPPERWMSEEDQAAFRAQPWDWPEGVIPEPDDCWVDGVYYGKYNVPVFTDEKWMERFKARKRQRESESGNAD